MAADIDTIKYALKGLSTEELAKQARMLTPRIVEQYMKSIPHPTQAAFMCLDDLECLFGGAAGGGKGLVLWGSAGGGDEEYNGYMGIYGLVHTPSRGFVRVDDVKVGDKVSNPDGSSTTVVGVYDRGLQDVYKVTFEDGRSVVVDSDHLWGYWVGGVRKNRKHAAPADLGDTPQQLWNSRYHNRAKVIRTEDLAELVDKANELKIANERPENINIPLTSPVAGTAPRGRRKLIPPYTLGVLLGDGTLSKDSVEWSKPEPEVASNVQFDISEFGYNWNVTTRSDGNSYGIVRGSTSYSPKDCLRSIGLDGTHSHDKFIPSWYLNAPVDIRFALAQGLMDTDGYVDERGHIEYCTVSEKLADGVRSLLWSLGYRVVVTTKDEPTYTHNGEVRVGRKAYRLWIQGSDTRRLFRLTRKRERCTEYNGGVSWPGNRITSIEKLEDKYPTRCITVDNPNGLFITNNYIVTHNSECLIMSALQYVDVPGYSALILRRTFADLNLPGAIMDRTKEWLSGTDAHMKDGGKLWEFPSGAKLQFGYLDRDDAKLRYQGMEIQFVGWDELTQFKQESSYSYLLSRLRKPTVNCVTCQQPLVRLQRHGEVVYRHTKGQHFCPGIFPNQTTIKKFPAAPDGTTIFDVPLRSRGATNPGGPGEEWVMRRFIDKRTKKAGTVFVPSMLDDNPSLDRASYQESLKNLSIEDQLQLVEGKWGVAAKGDMFDRGSIRCVEGGLSKTATRVRFWDMAATQDNGDWTVGALCAWHDGQFCIEDLVRVRKRPHELERILQQTAQADGINVKIRMEQEGGSSGKIVVANYAKTIFAGYNFEGIRSTGSKQARAAALASYARREERPVSMTINAWNTALLDEFSQFPNGSHDDIVDAVAGAYNELTVNTKRKVKFYF